MSEWLVTGRFDVAPLPDGWREELTRLLGAKPRRIGTWAEMVLYGALRCMADAGESTLPADAVLMLASRQGTRAATKTALGQMKDDLPMPLAFLQTQPSQALALLAERLAWRGQACFFAGDELAKVRPLAEAMAGGGGILLGQVDDDGAATSVWLRLRRRHIGAGVNGR
jgi:hypothetical protein